MSKIRNALYSREHHIKTLRLVIGVLTVLLLVALFGWMQAPRNLTIHNPPDLRSGSTRAWWEIPPSTVYAFTFYIFQQLNSWPKNGEEDYPYRIAALSPYLTPSCQEFLAQDALRKKYSGELNQRVRGVYEIPGRSYKDENVTVINRDNWHIKLDLVVDEYYHTEPVKRALVRYPIKVIRWENDPELNPFGLALDCYASAPQRLEAAPVEVKQSKGLFQ